MSLEVKVPTELTEYKEKIIFGLSLRQLIFTVIAVVMGGLSFWALYKPLGFDNASNVLVIIAAPAFAFGFINIKGYSLEKYLLIVYKHRYSPQKRIYKNSISAEITHNYKEKKDESAVPKNEINITRIVTNETDKRNRQRAIANIKAAKQAAKNKR